MLDGAHVPRALRHRRDRARRDVDAIDVVVARALARPQQFAFRIEPVQERLLRIVDKRRAALLDDRAHRARRRVDRAHGELLVPAPVVEHMHFAAVLRPVHAIDRPRVGERRLVDGDARPRRKVEHAKARHGDAIAGLQILLRVHLRLDLVLRPRLDEHEFVLLFGHDLERERVRPRRRHVHRAIRVLRGSIVGETNRLGLAVDAQEHVVVLHEGARLVADELAVAARHRGLLLRGFGCGRVDPRRRRRTVGDERADDGPVRAHEPPCVAFERVLRTVLLGQQRAVVVRATFCVDPLHAQLVAQRIDEADRRRLSAVLAAHLRLARREQPVARHEPQLLRIRRLTPFACRALDANMPPRVAFADGERDCTDVVDTAAVDPFDATSKRHDEIAPLRDARLGLGQVARKGGRDLLRTRCCSKATREQHDSEAPRRCDHVARDAHDARRTADEFARSHASIVPRGRGIVDGANSNAPAAAPRGNGRRRSPGPSGPGT